MTLIAVISDTHENDYSIAEAVEIMKKRNPVLVLHLGDIIAPTTLHDFAGLPMRFIFGNNDGERFGLQKVARELSWEITDTFETEIDGKTIFAGHGHRDDWIVACKEGYDYVFSGHTHLRVDEIKHASRHINPGALWRTRKGNPYSFVFLEVGSGTLEWIDIPKHSHDKHN